MRVPVIHIIRLMIVVAWLMSCELAYIWKEAVVAWLKVLYPAICLDGLRKPREKLWPGLNPGTHEYEDSVDYDILRLTGVNLGFSPLVTKTVHSLVTKC